MLRLNTVEPTSLSLRFGAAAVFALLTNCSPSSEPVAGQGGSNGNKGGSSSSSGGTNSGSGGATVVQYGGAQNGNGGAQNGSGGAGMGGSQAKGGGTSSSGGATTGSGGATTGSGGATTGSGGATTGSGGATTGSGGAASTCGTYAGTGADSPIFKDGFGASTTGKLSGYAFTYTYGTATIAPDTSKGTSCFKAAKVCASGSVPADAGAAPSTVYSGAGIGWNIGQASGSMTNTPAALTGSLKFTVSGIKAGMRLSIKAGTDEYCYNVTDTAALASAIPVSSFKTNCWDATGKAYTGAAAASLQVVVPGSATAATPFDFCLVDVEPGS